jgi:hypothetical protein
LVRRGLPSLSMQEAQSRYDVPIFQTIWKVRDQTYAPLMRRELAPVASSLTKEKSQVITLARMRFRIGCCPRKRKSSISAAPSNSTLTQHGVLPKSVYLTPPTAHQARRCE